MHSAEVERLDSIVKILLEILSQQKQDSQQTRTFLEKLVHQQTLIMSQITDAVAAVEQNLASIRAGITALDAKIQSFLDNVGTLDADDTAALAQIVADSATLATQANVMPTPTVPPAPPTSTINKLTS